jgi:hypothetical protein
MTTELAPTPEPVAEPAAEPVAADPLTLASEALNRAVTLARAARATAAEAEAAEVEAAEAALVAARVTYRAAREAALAVDGYTAIYSPC